MYNFLKSCEEIAELLTKNKIILMQTDTIFGLICRGDNRECIKKIEEIKQRSNPVFSFFVRDIEMAKKYVKMNDVQEQCFNAVFPGYFTLIFESKNSIGIPERCFGVNEKGKKTLGLRVPNNNMCLDVLAKVVFPIMATSANISHMSSPTTFESIDKQILENVDAIYYNENMPIAKLHSTIIDLSSDNAKIIRQGSGNIELLNGIISFMK